jgi:hypothetical protein
VALALGFIPARPLGRCQETATELHFLARAILCVGQVGNLSYVFGVPSCILCSVAPGAVRVSARVWEDESQS